MRKNIYMIDLYYVLSFCFDCTFYVKIDNVVSIISNMNALERVEYIMNKAFKVLHYKKRLEIEEINAVQNIIDIYSDIHKTVFYEIAA